MSIAFRTGTINAAGGLSRNPLSTTYECVTQQMVLQQAGTDQSGGQFTLMVNSYNTPCKLEQKLNWDEPSGMNGLRHPTGHTAAIADDYTVAMVLASHITLIPRWSAGAGALTTRFGVAYKFNTTESAATPAWPITVAQTQIIHDMKMTPGWVWSEYSSLGLEGDPNWGKIEIDIPDVPALVIAMNERTSTSTFTTDDLATVVADSDATPFVEVFLHVIVYKLFNTGVPNALGLGDISMDIRIKQTVKLWRLVDPAGLIDPGDDFG